VRFSRRSLLRRGVLALGVDPGLILGRLWRGRDPASLRVGQARPAAAAPSSKLSESELEDLIAFGEVLVQGRALSPVERDSLVGSIREHIARDQDYLGLCRTTISLLRRVAGGRFSSLNMIERVELIARLRLDSQDTPAEDHRGLLADAAHAVRTRARPGLIADYYNSPAGWAAVGYEVFPGRCGELERYTRREA
jgi:hypothetical protein